MSTSHRTPAGRFQKLLFGIFTIWIISFGIWQFTNASNGADLASQPPRLVQIGQLNATTPIGPHDEVRLAGKLVPDLGLRELPGRNGALTALVAEGLSGQGPLVVVLFDGNREFELLKDRLVLTDNEARLEVSGFIRSDLSRDATVDLRSAAPGRPVYVLEPYFGPRSDAYAARAPAPDLIPQDLIGPVVIWLLWGGRILMNRRPRAPKPARKQQHQHARVPANPAPHHKPQASPWGSFTPQSSQSKPAAPRPAPPPMDDPIEEFTGDLPEFTSVFPGGGSEFRFKSAEQIIRQSFGTFSGAIAAKRDDEHG